MHLINIIRFTIGLVIAVSIFNPAALALNKQTPAHYKVAQIKDQYIVAEGFKLHYVQRGTGQPVVLLHGNDGTLQDFTMSIFNNLTTKYRTIAFDRPGHGGSINLTYKTATPEIQACALHNALNQLDIRRPLLIAHSWSGALALSYALQFPDDLSGLVILGGMAYDTREAEASPIYYAVGLPFVGTLVSLTFKMTGRDVIKKQLKQAFSPDKVPEEYMKSFLSSLFRFSQIKAAASDEITLNPALRRMSPNYSNIHLPVVIVTGDQDRIVSPEKHSYPLHKAIPQSQLIVLHNAGHELQFTRPNEVMSAVELALTPVLKASIPTTIKY